MDQSFDPDGDTTQSMSLDYDGDGYAETTLVDSTGDGVVDTVVEEDPWTGASGVVTDTDGDGFMDTYAVDHDGDGLIDEAYTEHDFVDGSEADATSPVDDGPFSEEPGRADESLDEGVHGEPRADIEYHQVQPGPVDCLPTSVAMVLSEVTGDDVPAADLVEMANDAGFMNDQGMAADGALTLLENYGVDAELTSGTVDDMRAALEAGDPIIVGLDSADLYSGGGGPFDPGLEAGHAVVVTGIDDGPPGMVYINDPGFPDGAGVEIPLEMFEDAWEDADNTMVTVEVPAGGADEDAATSVSEAAGGEVEDSDTGAVEADGTPAVDASGANAIRRLLLLPLTFVVES